MDIGTMSLLLLVAIFVLLAIGVPLGFATGLLGAIIIFFKFGEPGLGLVMQRVYDLAVTYAIIAVPLFIFMASLLERSGIARDMYDALNVALGRMRGGVAVVTTVMAVIMAAMSGIIGGEIVLLGLVALPQMLRLGYNQNLAIGTICAGGSLGTMIPPSVVLIMFGLITETSINALFTAAFLPGLADGGALHPLHHRAHAAEPEPGAAANRDPGAGRCRSGYRRSGCRRPGGRRFGRARPGRRRLGRPCPDFRRFGGRRLDRSHPGRRRLGRPVP